jgi:hypothetical protein
VSRPAAVAVAALAVACLGAVAVIAGLGDNASPPAPPRPLSATTSVAPRPAFFADPVTARAEVLVDRRLVDPDSVRVDTDFTPYTLVGSPVESRADSGSVTSIGYRFRLSCLVEACLPDRQRSGVVLPPLRVQAALRSGGAADVSVPWPRVEVTPRVAATALRADPPPWRLQLGLAPVTYRVRPGALAAALTAAAVVLALGALALVAWELARRRRLKEERARLRSALARALELARESAAREPDDRRRALALLARVLAFDRNGGRRLAPAAAGLAWGRADPSPAGLRELVDEVERAVGSE